MTPLNFAFVACNRNAERFREDPSFIYRCQNMAAALTAAGHQVSLFHLTKFPFGKHFDAVVFHRPHRTLRFDLTLFRLKGHKRCVLIADVDDLIFDEAYAEFSPGVVNGLVPLPATRKKFLAHRLALGKFDLITVSTLPLAEHIATSFPTARVEIFPNAVPLAWRKAEGSPLRLEKEQVISYFPGTRSHDRDFSVIVEPLARFLAKYPQSRLQVTGPLDFELPARTAQVLLRAKVPFDVYPALFREAWVNLAPLESTPFNRCKSALKVLEAGYWNVPTLCSPSPDTERFIGAGALPAGTPDLWFEQLESLLDPDRYRTLTEKLRERVLKIADITGDAARLVQVVFDTRAARR